MGLNLPTNISFFACAPHGALFGVCSACDQYSNIDQYFQHLRGAHRVCFLSPSGLFLFCLCSSRGVVWSALCLRPIFQNFGGRASLGALSRMRSVCGNFALRGFSPLFNGASVKKYEFWKYKVNLAKIRNEGATLSQNSEKGEPIKFGKRNPRGYHE